MEKPQKVVRRTWWELRRPEADRNAENKNCAHEVSEGNCTRGHLYYILAKKLSTFCSYPETFNEDELKCGGLINPAEAISRQHSIQEVTRIFYQLLVRCTERIRSR